MIRILILAAICSLTGQVYAQVPAASAKYRAIVIRESRMKGGLGAPVAMFAGQLTQESGWNPNAHSGVGAQGLAQFMPATSLWISKVYPKDLPGAASLDPNWSIRALIYYDYWIYARLGMYQTVDENRWAASLSGFNGGLGWAQKDARIGSCSLWWGCADSVADGRTAANLVQNRDYPRRIIRLYEPRFLAAGWR